MPKDLSIRVPLNIDNKMYASLLQEAGGIPREVQRVIREKIEASYLSKNDAKRLLDQQEAANKMLIEIIRTQVVNTAYVAMQLDGLDSKKRETFHSNFKEVMAKQIDKMQRFNQEAER